MSTCQKKSEAETGYVDIREIAIYRVEGAFFASVDRCTHGDAALSEGIVIDTVIECPLHQGRFCIRDGRALSPPVSERMATFPTKVEGGKIYIRF